MDAAIDEPALAANLPYLQAAVAMDDRGIARLRRAIGRGKLEASAFYSIANGAVGDAPPDALGPLLMDMAGLDDGVEIALDILHVRYYRDGKQGRSGDPGLVAIGRELLVRSDFTKTGPRRDFGLNTVIRVCCSGPEGEAVTRTVCQRIRTEMETVFVSTHDLGYVLTALFQTQPMIALDTFLLPGEQLRNRRIFDTSFGFGTQIEEMDPTVLRQWAEHDTALRYPLLGQCIAMFKTNIGEEGEQIAPLFLAMLSHAPNKRAFLGDFMDRLRPNGWSGSLADTLMRRRAQLQTLADGPDPEICGWVADMLPDFDRWIEHERGRERSRAASFE